MNLVDEIAQADPGAPVVRSAQADDCAALAAIYADAIEEGVSSMDTGPVSAGYFLDLLVALNLRERLLVIARPRGVLGWGIVKRYSDRPGYRVACETSVYIAAGQQGRGLGSQLQREIERSAQSLGYRHLVAKILAINEASIRFHRRHGYELVGTQRRIGYLNGRWHDVVIMQRLLDD